jgi:methyltransferase (TIGR00027 family)
MVAATINDVSDTALWVAAYRASESARPDALFRDVLAGKLAGERGQALAVTMPGAAQFAWAVVVRTRVIDRYVADAVADGCDAVVNIGAGLDTRPHRLDLPTSLQWFEIDLPSMVSYKEDALAGAEPPTCKLERIGADLADAEQRRAALRDVAQRGRRILVLTEGVIGYLGDDDVAALARDLRSHASFAAWIVDHTSPFLSKRMKRRRDVKARLQNAPVRFAPADWQAFFREQGWDMAEMRYLTVEGERLGRPPPLPCLFRAINAATLGRFDAEVKRMLGYARLTPRAL